MSDSNPQSFLANRLNGDRFSLVKTGDTPVSINRLLDDFFSNKQLVLTNARQDDPSNPVVKGKLEGSFFGSNSPVVSLTFSTVSGNIEMAATITPSEVDWTLATAFPKLKNSFLESTRISNPEFTLDSQKQTLLPTDFFQRFTEPKSNPRESPPTIQGLSFSGKIDANQISDNVRWLAFDQDATLIAINGPIELDDGVPNLLLTAANKHSISFLEQNFPTEFHLVAISDNADQGLKRVNCFGVIEATVSFIANGIQVSLPFIATFSQPNSYFLELECNHPTGLGLSDLTGLIVPHGSGIELPDVFPSPDRLTIEQFGFFITLPKKQIDQVHLALGLSNEWGMFSNFIVFKNMRLILSSFRPFDNTPALSVYGVAAIDDHELDCQIDLPDLSFRCALAANESVDLTKIIRDHLSNSVPVINCTGFNVFGNIKENQYSIFVRLQDDMKFDWGDKTFALSAVEITANFNAPTKGRLKAEFQIGDSLLFISGEDTGSAGGWIFQGGTLGEQKIEMRHFFDDLAAHFGSVQLPNAISGLTVSRVFVSMDTSKKAFQFELDTQLPVGAANSQDILDIVIRIEIKDNQGKYDKSVSGHFVVGSREFDLQFNETGESMDLIGAYQNKEGEKIQVKELIEPISPSFAEDIPDSLSIIVKDVYLAMLKNGNDKTFLFGLDLGADFSLSNLPLVGKQFPKDQNVGVENLQLVVASGDLTTEQVASINGILPDGIGKLPAKSSPASSTSDAGSTKTNVGLTKGLSLAATLQMGDKTQSLTLPVTPEKQAAATPGESSKPAAVVADDPTKWFEVNKSFGPVHFSRVGVNFKDKVLTFAMDAALSVGPLTLSLDGLSMGSPIDHFEPKFDLKGIGLDFKSGPLEIGGQFLRQTINGIDEYSGLAIIKTEELTLTAIGSYAELDGHPSLFIYAVLDYPIGGPSFFFVTGLAAGFGYNRRLIIPAVGKLGDFPLISTASGNSQAPAIPGQDISTTVTDQLRTLSTYIPPSFGDYFLAVGIKFSSFKMIDSIAVLVIQFGKHDFEVDLLGMSTLIVPTQIPGQPPVTPIAEVQLAVKATFQPAEGFLGVQAELTDKSFILDRKCKLTGGFAFYSWFSGEHTGDFVLTLGGYHPDFKAPAHYPSVPRLGLTWQVTNELSIKGTLYYALTSTALMAGGSFSATYTDGGLQAWFNASADFLFAWKPYHYDARISVNMGVKYSFLSIDVGADIHLWGPDFAGTAHISLSIISFDVDFGSNNPPIALPIPWDEFKASFIAKDDTGQYQVCSIKAEKGLAKEIEVDIEGGKKQKRWVINPKEFSITTDSVIPSNQPAHDVIPGNTNFGVAPMAKHASEVSSTQQVVITKRTLNEKGESTEIEVQGLEFSFQPLTKSVPAALWGESFSPNLNGERLVKDVLSGYQIAPKSGLVPGESHLIEKKELQYDTWELADCFGWEDYQPKSIELSQAERENQVASSINATNTSAKRRQLLSSILGEDLELEDLSEFNVADFNIAPQIEDSVLSGEPL